MCLRPSILAWPPWGAGLVWGWPAAAPLLAPCLAWALWRGPATSMLRTLLLCLLATLGPQLLADRIFYGRWVVSACQTSACPPLCWAAVSGRRARCPGFWRLSWPCQARKAAHHSRAALPPCVQVTQLNWAAHYLWPSTAANSSTAGREGPSFYRSSAGSDFGLLLPLALALPLLAQLPGAARSLCAVPAGPGLPTHVAKDGATAEGSCDGEPGEDEAEPGSKQAEGARRGRRDLLLATLPLYAWALLLSLLPRKQAHFLYPVYPLVGGRAWEEARSLELG